MSKHICVEATQINRPCVECNKETDYNHCLIYNEMYNVHYDCVKKLITRLGVHLLDLELIFNKDTWNRELWNSRYDSDFRPKCRLCGISDAPIRLMIWYKYSSWIHPHCVLNDPQFNEWKSIWLTYHSDF